MQSESILIGRPNDVQAPDLDLSPDIAVSRRHALMHNKAGAWWLEDLNSKMGTRLNGRDIKGQGECRLHPGDEIQIGETLLRLEWFSAEPAASPPVAQARPAPAFSAPAHPAPVQPAPARPPAKPAQNSAYHILKSLPSSGPIALPAGETTRELQRQLALLCDLPAQFSRAGDLTRLFQIIVERVVDVIPPAKRGAFLLLEPAQKKLLLKAFVSPDQPAVSITLARRALQEGQAFIWRTPATQDVTMSMVQHRLQHGMYAPIQWQNQALGVICVDSSDPEAAFTEGDLHLLMAVAQYAAIALANKQLQDDLQQKALLLERLMVNFSPKIRDVLLEQARHGRLRPGGQKSEVSILFADICGFTKMAAQMDTHEVVDVLNVYFPALAEAIFRFDGTIDKFIGDAVLAVFGSPTPDPDYQAKAIKAAWAMQTTIQAINEQRARRGDPSCLVSIGIHSGEVLHGFIGAAERMEFTVIGDAVNRACRFCQGAGDGEILISPEVYQQVFSLIQAEKTTLQSKEGPLPAYRVKGLR